MSLPKRDLELPELLTFNEVCGLLDCDHEILHKLVIEGKIAQTTDPDTGKNRFRREDVLDLAYRQSPAFERYLARKWMEEEHNEQMDGSGGRAILIYSNAKRLVLGIGYLLLSIILCFYFAEVLQTRMLESGLKLFSVCAVLFIVVYLVMSKYVRSFGNVWIFRGPGKLVVYIGYISMIAVFYLFLLE